MLFRRILAAAPILIILSVVGTNLHTVECLPHRILYDTDVETADLLALLYILKLNRSEFNLEAITISPNAWSDAGHAVNHIYDILYMMDRDDIVVGVGGDGGIMDDGTILPDVGGYFPIIEQGSTTVGGCRYRQAIPKGQGGRLDVDLNYGIRREFLPQGRRKYSPLQQPTSQQVLIEKVSAGPITILMSGTHTNVGIFLMTHPNLKKNIEHIHIMGGGVRSKNPTGCCPKSSNSSCTPTQCGTAGNLFTDYTSNPYAEFNIFGDPFAAYQVIHSGIPVTLIPLDATNTIPITKEFFDALKQQSPSTYEAQYVFKSLKMAHDTWFDDNFYTSYFMWDSFMAGVAVAIMRNSQNFDGANDIAEMECMNITVVTSNKPYGINDGSNPFFDDRSGPKFNLKKDGVHSGHVQTGLRDPFCIAENGEGKCKDGYTKEVAGPDTVRVLVATKAKPNREPDSPLNREYFRDFLNVLTHPQHTGRFNFTTQFPYYNEVFYKPDFSDKELGKPVIFDMDMSAGDFLALFYLLKVPVEKINLKAIIVSSTGWANAATIDVIYDILHMMGRDNILVGLEGVFAMNQSDSLNSAVGDCKYIKAIPEGSGGFLDSDTLYGLARDLPRSPRRYTAENSVKHGAPRDTDHPELRQPSALEIWDNVTKSLDAGSKITILTNGALTSLVKILSSAKSTISLIQDAYIVGGHISNSTMDLGNVFTIPSNKYTEFNMFLDPLAAKTVFESELDITLIPLGVQRSVNSFSKITKRLRQENKTPEALFAHCLLSMLQLLKQSRGQYQHMDMFLGEVLGAVVLASDHSLLKPTTRVQPIEVIAEGVESKDGQIVTNGEGKLVKVLEHVDSIAYYNLFADQLGEKEQSAVIASFDEQSRIWSKQPSVRDH